MRRIFGTEEFVLIRPHLLQGEKSRLFMYMVVYISLPSAETDVNI